MYQTTQITAQIAAVQGFYGHRLFTYATQLSPLDLEEFIGHDPRSRHWRKLDPALEDLYRNLQRTTIPDRLKSIQTFIKRRMKESAIVPGAFPSISVAVKQWIEFEPFEDAGRGLKGAGTLFLRRSKSNTRVVLDGLARVSAILELIEEINELDLPKEEREATEKIVNSFTLPLVIFSPQDKDAPLTLREMRQLFVDFNFKQTSISPTMAMSFDSSDIYIEATKRLGETDVVERHGGVEMGSATLGAKSTALVALQNFVRFTRAAAEGDLFAEMKTNVDKDESKRRLSEEIVDGFVENVRLFLSGMAETMGSARFRDIRDSVHTTGPGWGALGAVFHDLDVTLGHHEYQDFGRRVGKIDMRKSADVWSEIMRLKEYKTGPRLTFLGGGHEARQAVRRKIHEHLGTWEAVRAKRGVDEEAAADNVEVAAAE